MEPRTSQFVLSKLTSMLSSSGSDAAHSRSVALLFSSLSATFFSHKSSAFTVPSVARSRFTEFGSEFLQNQGPGFNFL
jgi:hypothetical protein